MHLIHPRATRCLALVTLALVSVACGASFTDGRPPPASQDQGPVNGGLPDQAPPADKGQTGADGAASTPDSVSPDTGVPAGVVADGPFEGRGGYTGKGTAELYVDAQGKKTLRFGASFSTSAVPGPVVLLSSRAAIGTSINKSTDLHLGQLKSTSGAQVYDLPAGDGGRRYAWIYCEPFGVEVARAKLTDRP